jgi:hypothetical protein
LTTKWAARAREEANLLNPDFLARLVERSAAGHRERSQTGLPFPLAFLSAPIVLHKPTRDALPSTVNTSMATWTQGHPLLVSQLAERGRSLAPLVREALLFGLAHHILRCEGDILLPPLRRRRRPPGLEWHEPTDDYLACMKAALQFGRWCAGSGEPSTIYALWKVRP